MGVIAIHIAIIGLGLIGGSLAYALRGFQNAVITGADTDAETRRLALRRGAVDAVFPGAASVAADADLTVFCAYPGQIETDMETCAAIFRRPSVVADVSGLKGGVASIAARVLPEGVDYVGIHPMAGKASGGFANADGALFKDCGFIVTPGENTRPESVELIRDVARHIGAGRVEVADAARHDAIVAYTSHLPHIAAAGLCMDFPPDTAKAFMGGAFRDCTRIADIDPLLWEELLMSNREFTLPELDGYIRNLSLIRSALENGDGAGLRELLKRARDNKRELEKR